MKNKKILVSWTGGLDSTYLILKLLNEGHYVNTVYTEIVSNINQIAREKHAVNNIIKYFNNYHNYLGHKEIKSCSWANNLCFQQFPSILKGLIETYNDHDEVAIGYVMNDDIISFIPDITKVWNSYKNICHERFPKITFPIIKEHKKYIYLNTPNEYLQYVTWCERTDNKKTNCGKCPSCLRMNNIISSIKKKS